MIEHQELRGPVNVCSPYPLPNAEFMKGLRDAWGARFGLPAMTWMLEIGAVFIRTETELILKSRRVSPGKLQASGFKWEFEKWEEAAKELCERWKTE
jgi:NAD dependent epimerase/dehydratase family enzyme